MQCLMPWKFATPNRTIWRRETVSHDLTRGFLPKGRPGFGSTMIWYRLTAGMCRVLSGLMVLSASLGWYSGPASAALHCYHAGNKSYYCTDIVGLENQDIVLRGRDVVGTDSVFFGEQEYCIISYSTPSLHSAASAWRRLVFDVQLDGDNRHGGFVLRNAQSTLPVRFQWRGGAPVSGAPAWESPGPGRLTSDQQGALSCNDKPHSQAWLRFEVSSSSLQQAQPGTYSGSFSVDVGQELEGYHDEVHFTVHLPRMVRISGLQDVVLSDRGPNDDRYQQSVPFCVFVSGGGDYRIRASGGPGPSDSFSLKQAGNFIKYRVRLSSNGTNNVTVAPGRWLDAHNGSSSVDCNGGTNTQLLIVMLDSWAATKPAGIYVGTLYLTVEPN